MPPRKKPPSLQTSCLKRIGGLFKASCVRIINDIMAVLEREGITLSFAQAKALKSSLLSDPLTQIQQCFFVDTAYYFHEHILIECLVALSDLLNDYDEPSSETITAFISPKTPCIENNNQPRLIQRTKKEMVLEFLDILCYPGAFIKRIDISIDKLGSRWKLHKSIINGLSDRLIHMPMLEELNFGHWSCRRLGLLSDHNQSEGWPLEFLTNLKVLKLHDVSQRFFQSVGSYCHWNLRKLHIFNSDITDTVTWWVSKCQNLETIELFEDREVTPIGYAQLLRSNPNLRSLGRCDCFGKVLSLLYDPCSLYRRSYVNMPEHLNLEEIDTNGQLDPIELKHLTQRCPNLKRIRFKYLRTNNDEEGQGEHLSKLAVLDHLTQWSISSANFYEHQIFNLLEVRGDQLVHLELVEVDEVNLNAILLLGSHCINLQKLCLHGCHFQMQVEDARVVDELCCKTVNPDPDQRPKKVRLTSLSHDLTLPFEKLQSLDIYLKSPTHLPIFQYLVYHAVYLETLIFDQFYCDYDETLIHQSLLEWNSMEYLKELQIGHGSRLSVVTVNIILAQCHQLQRLGKLDQWGQIDRQQIESIRKEIEARNLDLSIICNEMIP